MSYTKEFLYPLIPVVFETLMRILVLQVSSWVYYVNPGTVLVVFAIWSSLTSIKVPANSPIETDTEYGDGLGLVRTILSVLAMVGFICFGGSVIADVAGERTFQVVPDLDLIMQGIFVWASIIYGIITFIFVVLNRNKIEGLFNA